MVNKTKVTALDQLYGAVTFVQTLLHRDLPKNGSPKSDKNPIVLIPGIMQKWNVFRKVIPKLQNAGYPVYIIKELKRNNAPIADQAKLVKSFIDRNNLTKVIILGHSKGGLIGKYLLAFYNYDLRIKKVIAINSPFHGTKAASYLPFGSHKEVIPGSELLKKIENEKTVNLLITSIYGQWDNLIIPVESCRLEGANNIKVPFSGHHRMMFNIEVINLILGELAN